MKPTTFAFPALLLLGQTLALGQSTPPGGGRAENDQTTLNFIEGQAIQVMLDGVGSAELGSKRFFVASYSPGQYFFKETIVAHILAWLEYDLGDQFVTVSYFMIPLCKKLSDCLLKGYDYQNDTEYKAFLQKMIRDGKIADANGIKQLKISLPVGLQDNVWFDRLCKIYEYSPYSPIGQVDEKKPKITLEWIKFDDCGPYYYWGIKSNEVEHIQGYSFRDGTLVRQAEYEILKPIIKTILEYETSKEWKDDYEKYATGKID
jgi:hypothetical protein